MPESPQIATIEEDVESEQPREGTLAWLQLQPHVEVLGLQLPDVHRVLDGSQLAPEDDDPGHCRIVRPDGRRCRSTPTRRYGVCLIHAGGGMRDYASAARAAHAAKARLKVRRELLGIGPNRVGSARSHARLRALARAEELAEALVDGPLDAPGLGPIERQRAALAALDATFPLQRLDVELELPASPDEAESLSWESMQRLAAQLLTSG